MLKMVIHWIAKNGIMAYDAIQISKDLDIDVSMVPSSAENAFDSALSEAVLTTIQELNITAPRNSDELFDCILTFFESIEEYKDDFITIFSPLNLGFGHLKLFPVFQGVSQCLFNADIATPLDKITYSLILMKLFHTWLQDTSPDLALTSHSINQIAQKVFNEY
jgi:hypothetical protein